MRVAFTSITPGLHEAVFAGVIDSMKMLRNYVQILRSGTVGRKVSRNRSKAAGADVVGHQG